MPDPQKSVTALPDLGNLLATDKRLAIRGGSLGLAEDHDVKVFRVIDYEQSGTNINNGNVSDDCHYALSSAIADAENVGGRVDLEGTTTSLQSDTIDVPSNVEIYFGDTLPYSQQIYRKTPYNAGATEKPHTAMDVRVIHTADGSSTSDVGFKSAFKLEIGAKITGALFHDMLMPDVYDTDREMNEDAGYVIEGLEAANIINNCNFHNCPMWFYGQAGQSTFSNIRGTPLKRGFNITRARDFFNIFNVNGTRNTYYPPNAQKIKMQLESIPFEFGNVDGGIMINSFFLEVDRLIVAREFVDGDTIGDPWIKMFGVGVDSGRKFLDAYAIEKITGVDCEFIGATNFIENPEEATLYGALAKTGALFDDDKYNLIYPNSHEPIHIRETVKNAEVYINALHTDNTMLGGLDASTGGNIDVVIKPAHKYETTSDDASTSRQEGTHCGVVWITDGKSNTEITYKDAWSKKNGYTTQDILGDNMIIDGNDRAGRGSSIDISAANSLSNWVGDTADVDEGGQLPYDLTGWKLQQPVDNNNRLSGDSADILSPAVVTHESDYFIRGGGIFKFICPSVGATTPSATYSRSELRHLTDHAWNVETEMKVEFSVDDMEDGHKSIILQIHDTAEPAMKIVYQSAGEGASDGKMEIFYRATEGATETKVDISTGLSLETVHQVRVLRTTSKLEVYLDGNVDGGTPDFTTVGGVEFSRSGINPNYYWKMGNYYQFNTGSFVSQVTHYDGTWNDPRIVGASLIVPDGLRPDMTTVIGGGAHNTITLALGSTITTAKWFGFTIGRVRKRRTAVSDDRINVRLTLAGTTVQTFFVNPFHQNWETARALLQEVESGVTFDGIAVIYKGTDTTQEVGSSDVVTLENFVAYT